MNVTRRTFLIWTITGLVLPGVWLGRAGAEERKPRVINIRIAKRKVVEPRGTIRVTEQDVIELRFSTDEPVKLHLHGYDKELDVAPGKPTSMSITAYATGRFPITSHSWGHDGHGHQALTYIEVYPR